MSNLGKGIFQHQTRLPPKNVRPQGFSNDPDRSDSSDSSTSTISSVDTVVPDMSFMALDDDNEILSPLAWKTYFAQSFYIESKLSNGLSSNHNVYLTPPPDSRNPVLFVMHHGAGSSGLSFAVTAKNILDMEPRVGVLAFDARGHGKTFVGAANSSSDLELAQSVSSIEEDHNFSLQTLASDLEAVLDGVMTRLGMPNLSVVLVGHSLGGAVVVEVANQRKTKAKILAYAVLDVVEGSAIDALTSMQQYLSSRPSTFQNLHDAVDWHVRSRTIKNIVSARVSVPSLLKVDFSDQAVEQWTWRTDLRKTQPFWEQWFAGLSSKFLSARGGKLLLLAGTDRLDKEMTIGQMQGKYQMQVFQDAGHFVHEDQPERTASLLIEFWKRNDGSLLVLPPKVSDLIAQGIKV